MQIMNYVTIVLFTFLRFFTYLGFADSRNFRYTSIVNKVLAELNIEVKSDIRAANITLIIIPRKPSGIIPRTNLGYAIFEQLTGF